ARRKEYWTFHIVNWVIGLIPRAFIMSSSYASSSYAESVTPAASIIGLIFVLAVLIPDIAVTVRRLHDTNRSGWFCLISLIPIVGWILIIVWMCTDSNLGENDYGPDPKAEEDASFIS
ncbi:MAG: DUF805 domain-containing protein, partial [Caldisericia bacterium]|nr:DUF805 domain-containing protein [Caldisericia bacterium]